MGVEKNSEFFSQNWNYCEFWEAKSAQYQFWIIEDRHPKCTEKCRFCTGK